MRLEDAMEILAAHTDRARQLVEGGHLVGFFDRSTDLGDGGGVPSGEALPGGLAPLAGAEPRALRVLARRMEADVLTERPPRRARGPAIDAGRAHGVEERTVGGGVAAHDGLPSRFIIGEVTCDQIGLFGCGGHGFVSAVLIDVLLLKTW